MEAQLKALNLKLDQLLEMQQTILNKLSQSNMTPIELEKNIRTSSFNEPDIFSKEYFILITEQGEILKDKFNLKTTPQGNRIMAYLRSNDPKVFDGLKRKYD